MSLARSGRPAAGGRSSQGCEALELWSSTKCQRVVRPLKIKIAALERALRDSHSVADDVATWDGIHLRRKRQRATSGNDFDDAQPDQCRQQPRGRTYGQGRRQKKAAPPISNSLRSMPVLPSQTDEALKKSAVMETTRAFSAERFLADVRQSVSPALGQAYLAVFEAVRSIVTKAETPNGLPTLANLAARAVGRCVHLTSEAYTEDEIDADVWFEACPIGQRQRAVEGQVAQILESKLDLLRPIWPALVTLLPKQLALDLLECSLRGKALREMTRRELKDCLGLARQLGEEDWLRHHLIMSLQSCDVDDPKVPYVLQTEAARPLSAREIGMYLNVNVLLATESELAANETDAALIDRRSDLSLDLMRRIVLTADGDLCREILCLFVVSNSARHRTTRLAYALLDGDSSRLEVGAFRQAWAAFEAEPPALHQACMQLWDLLPIASMRRGLEILVDADHEMMSKLMDAAPRAVAVAEQDYFDSLRRRSADAQTGNARRFEPLLGTWVAKTPLSRQVDQRDCRQAAREAPPTPILHEAEDIFSAFKASNEPLPSVVKARIAIQPRPTDRQQSARLLQLFRKDLGRPTPAKAPFASPSPFRHLSPMARVASSPLHATKRRLFAHIESPVRGDAKRQCIYGLLSPVSDSRSNVVVRAKHVQQKSQPRTGRARPTAAPLSRRERRPVDTEDELCM